MPVSQPTVRISARTRATLRALSRHFGKTMQDLLDAAVEAYRRRLFLEETNAAFARLRLDPEDWAAVGEERAAWEPSLADGVEDEPAPWPRPSDGGRA
jgi:hypothetical protein